MSVSATSAVISQAAAGAPAGIQAWTGELVGVWLALGMVQTQDSGQLTLTGSGASTTTNAAQPTGVGVGNAVGYVVLTMPDALALGGISTTALVAAGSGGSNATYTNLTVTGVSSGATSARASVTVSGGAAGNMTITTAGTLYIAGEKLTVSQAGIPAAAAWMPTVLSSGSPIVLRLDFGAQTIVTDPQMWITVGTGTNGSGTVNGIAGTSKLTQIACMIGGAPLSTSTAYPSYYCYNPANGFLKAIFKIGSNGVGLSWSQTYIYRSNNNAGAATGAGVCMMTNSATTTGVAVGGPVGALQIGAYGTGVLTSVTPSSPTQASCTSWPGANTGASVPTFPFGLTTTLVNGQIDIIPSLYYLPGDYYFSAFLAVGLVADLVIGATTSLAIIGATPLTFMMDAAGAVGAIGNVASMGVVSLHL